MPHVISLAAGLLGLFISQSTSHFLLNLPPTIGFDDSLEATAPCGSFSVDFTKDNLTDFHVGGDAISVTSVHPQDTWLFRATLDQNVTSGFTTLRAAIQQTGLGAFCEPDVTVPASFAGQKGVIQVIADAPDGILYQCAAVNFVTGTGSANSACKNVTGLTAVYTTDPSLSAAIGGATAAANSTATGSTTSAGVSSTSSTKSSAAMGTRSYIEEAAAIMLFAGIASIALLATLL